MLDSRTSEMMPEPFIGTGYYATSSSLNHKYFNIRGNYSVPTFYYFGDNNSLNEIELQVATNEGSRRTSYKTVKNKLIKYYSTVCKVSPTKEISESDQEETYTWLTPDGEIKFTDRLDSNYSSFTIIMTPNPASNQAQSIN